MKRKKGLTRALSLLLAAVLCLPGSIPVSAKQTKEDTAATCAADATEYKIYPIPQSISYSEGDFALGEVAVVYEEGVDNATKNFLQEVLKNYDVNYESTASVQENKTNIILGIRGNESGAANTYVASKQEGFIKNADLFNKNDAYLLDASDNTIVILGKDADSVFYGVATLQMMFSSFAGKKFLNAHIEDYAAVATRGYIEGFYGSWDFEERENLMKFARDYKMNSYVYAAKGDAYHTSKWADQYPPETLEQLKKLVVVGEETKVKFAWSIHLGNFFKTFSGVEDENYEVQYKKLTDKLDQLIGIGVKRIDVLNDDFGGGSHETVVKVLNRLNTYLKDKGCEPLTYCPQGYNEAWSKWSSNATELSTLKGLSEDIHVYWTGADVNAPITQETVDYLTENSGHQPDFWLNYPVNEHAKSGIFLGDITYYARDGVTGLAGFHSNPCRYAYANEVGLYQLAALTWNNANYAEHAQEIWKSAFDYLQPEVSEAYFKIASNISNAPNSSRVSGFPESEYLAETIETVEDALSNGSNLSTLEAAKELLTEFQEIQTAVKDFQEKCENKDLVEQLKPWLLSLKELAEAGQAALESLMALEAKDASAGWEKLSIASKAYDNAYTHKLPADDLSDVAKAGTKRLSPTIGKLINEAKNQLTPILNPDDTTVTPTLYAVIGGTTRTDDANGKKLYDGDLESCATWNTNQQAGDYYGLDLGRVIRVNDITVLQGNSDTDHDIFHKARLEYSTDGKNWVTIEGADFSDGSAPHQISKTGLNIQARYVRMYLIEKGTAGKADYWTHVREFTVNRKTEEKDRIYTNVEALKDTPLTLEGAEISFRDLSNVTLQPGQYVGIKLVEPAVAVSFAKEASANGLVLEYSYNGTQWKEAPLAGDSEGVAVKYLRLMNKTEAAVTANIQKVGMSVKYLKADPEFLSTTIAGLAEGTYDNVFDGDLSTYILTSQNQQDQTYLTFDLGKTIEVYDVTAITTDGEERFYSAKLQVSQDNTVWTDVAEAVNDNSIMEVPYRYVRGNGNGVSARYFRILFTGNAGSALKLYEIQINQAQESGQEAKQIVTNLSGNVNALTDNNIATLFSGEASNGSYVEYRITENTNVEQVSVLQGAAGKGKVYAVTPETKKFLGALDQSVCVFDTSSIDTICAIRIEWEEADKASIHEIHVTYGADTSGDLGTVQDPIVIESGEKPYTNIASKAAVTVSGTSDGNKEYVKDGDLNTKWDSNAIKSGSGNNAADIGDSWICFDFGTEKNYEINKLVVYYFNKIYPTSWVIQTSSDAEQWTNVTDTLTKENGGTAHPVETVEFETPIAERYVRLYFNTLNTAAAGNGVGIKEVEINGREAAAKAPISKQQNLALNKTVTVSGTSNGVKESINDGDTSTKWDSDFIKGNDAKKEAWAVIDLGEETNLIDAVKISYFNKVYPTRYQIQISNDQTNWTTVKTLSKDHDGPTHPVDEIIFETPVSARYVRLLFTELNNVAAGNGVGINEAEVLGRQVSAEIRVKEVETLEDITLEQKETFDVSVLPKTLKIKAEGSELTEDLSMIVPVIWDASDVDTAAAGNYTVKGTLSLHNVENTKNLTGQVKVVVEIPAPVLDHTALEQALEAAGKLGAQSKYTSASYAVFAEAYEKAENAKTQADTQEKIDAAASELTAAIAGLKERVSQETKVETGNTDKEEPASKPELVDKVPAPEKPADSSATQKTQSTQNTVSTGDSASVFLWSMMMAVMLAGILVLKKRENG